MTWQGLQHAAAGVNKPPPNGGWKEHDRTHSRFGGELVTETGASPRGV